MISSAQVGEKLSSESLRGGGVSGGDSKDASSAVNLSSWIFSVDCSDPACFSLTVSKSWVSADPRKVSS